MADDVRSASDAAMPDTIDGLRRQNSAYRALCASLETQMAILTAKGREYQEAVTTLDSEREANAILTAENARLTEERDALVEAAEYLIGQFKKVSRGVAVRDLDEALGAYDSAIAKVKGGTDAR